MRILLAEDEVPLAKAIVRMLEKDHYCADAVHNGLDALNYLESGNYDAAVLDVMMPQIDGIAVLQKLRADGNQIPVIILTAKSQVDDKIWGLDSGANDYMTKPFHARELLARLRTITRNQTLLDSKITFGNIVLDRAAFALSSPSGCFRLANKEFQMIEMLMSNPGHLVSTERLMEKVWGYNSEVEIHVVWVYISYLRKKLTALHANIQIKSTQNAGYSLEEL